MATAIRRVSHAGADAALGSLLEALPQPTLLVTADLRIMAGNAPAREIFPRLRLGEPLALSLRDPTVLDAARRVERGGQGETVIWRDRFPVERHFDVSVAAFAAPGGERSLVLTLDDVTEARRIEQMRADFIANASHELRTPLASVLGFIETLQGPAKDDSRARERFLGIMAEQGRRMARLVDDLLSLSRIEGKRHIRPNEAVDLSAVVRHVADTLSALAEADGMRLDLVVEDSVVVAGDRDELVRVAENLIENAIKYGRRSGAGPGDQRIAVTLKAEAGFGRLLVRDFGDGIPAEHLPRLTERFYRIDAGQSRAKGGTGLGLALVKHITAHHRGKLTIDSRVGVGSTFAVAIPRRESAVRTLV